MARRDEIIISVQPYTKSSEVRLRSMYWALKIIDKDHIPGDIVECGVWRGGNIMMSRLVCPDRLCWLYDTFNGMTEPHHEFDFKRSSMNSNGEKAIDRYRAKQNGGTKWDAVSLLEVQNEFERLGLIDGTIWVEGDIVKTLDDGLQPSEIAILRLDVDWYEPTKAALEHLYPRLVSGGFLIIDDYGHWMGCRKAVDDYFGVKARKMQQVDYSCVMMRKS